MGFGKLRVINDDWIAPHEGFGAHQHRDMEIITVVTKGVLTHEDSMGNHGVIPEGDVQIMSAGSGVTHSEKNDGDEPLTLFQIWIEADEKGITPRYGQQAMHLSSVGPGLTLLVAPLGTPDVLTINQHAYMYLGVLDASHPVSYVLKDPKHGMYMFVVEGSIEVAGASLGSRDAIAITEPSEMTITSSTEARVFIFEVPL